MSVANARFTQGEHEYAKVVVGQAGDTASLMNEIGRIKKTPAEKERMMDSLKIARLEIFERVASEFAGTIGQSG